MLDGRVYCILSIECSLLFFLAACMRVLPRWTRLDGKKAKNGDSCEGGAALLRWICMPMPVLLDENVGW